MGWSAHLPAAVVGPVVAYARAVARCGCGRRARRRRNWGKRAATPETACLGRGGDRRVGDEEHGALDDGLGPG